MGTLPIPLQVPIDEWLADLDAPLRELLSRAEAYAAGTEDPPTERQFTEALNAIRTARWDVRQARRSQKGAMS
jgi:hypothetical protein